MRVIFTEKVYKQQGAELVFDHSSNNELHTTIHTKEQPYFALNTVMNDFRKHDLWYGTDFVTEQELYFDDKLVAKLTPCFTINGETFVSTHAWHRCYSRNGDDTKIGNTLVTKQFNLIISQEEVCDILVWNFIDSFPEGNLQ